MVDDRSSCTLIICIYAYVVVQNFIWFENFEKFNFYFPLS